MKLLFCPDCGDIFNLTFKHKRCSCGLVSGYYKNRVETVVNGEGVSLAIGNGSLQQAMCVGPKDFTERDRGWWIKNGKFMAWVRPHSGDGNPHTSVDENI